MKVLEGGGFGPSRTSAKTLHWIIKLLIIMPIVGASLYAQEGKQQMGRSSDPNSPTIDLNQVVAEKCEVVFSGSLSCGKSLIVVAPKNLPLDNEKLLSTYNQLIAGLENMSGRTFPRDLRLVVIPVKAALKNYTFSPSPERFTDLALLDESAPGDVMNKILCELAHLEPHELWHEISPSTTICSGKIHGAGWFSEGLANYAAYLHPISECPLAVGEETALKAFKDREVRSVVWEFCPGRDMHKKLKKKKGKDMAAFWAQIDTGYAVSFGVFLYLEKRLGREKLGDVIRQLQKKHRCQDDDFYKDLVTKFGFDIRKVTQEEVEAVLGKPENGGA